MTKSAQFHVVADLTRHLHDGKDIVADGVCFDGTLAVLVENQANHSMSVLRFDKDLVEVVEIKGEPPRYPYVQFLPTGEVLIASSVARFVNNEKERNASVYDKNGQLLRQFTLGDAINDMRVANNSEIWVSYFDEGVFGNTSTPHIGQPGLCCFSSNGELVWWFEAGDGLESIDDCYALNVFGNEAWTSYYSSFPIVRIDQAKKLTSWKDGICAASAIATDGHRILFFGGYHSRGEDARCIVQTLEDGKATNASSYEVTPPPGLNDVRKFGHGADLHAFVCPVWYKLSLSDLD
jgi:hypothetical protein